MSDYTIVEKYQQNKNTAIAIRPFFNPNKDNMGLQNYGMALHEGVWHEESLACLEMNGVKRYLTGLNEFAPEVKRLSPGEREIKIKEIRTTVAQLEAELAANVDPSKDSYDLIKIYAINAGGFAMVAKSLKEAKKAVNAPKFYLDQLEETISERTVYTKLRNRALSVQYTKSTPNDIMYENMDMYINGEGTESNSKRAAQQFLDASKDSMEDLKIRALVKDALFYRFIVPKSSGWIETMDSSEKLGKRSGEVIEYLKNPANEDTLLSLLSKVEPYWNS